MSFCKQDKHILGNMANIIPQLNKQFQARVSQEWFSARSPIQVCGMARVCLIRPARGLNLASSLKASPTPSGVGGV